MTAAVMSVRAQLILCLQSHAGGWRLEASAGLVNPSAASSTSHCFPGK